MDFLGAAAAPAGKKHNFLDLNQQTCQRERVGTRNQNSLHPRTHDFSLSHACQVEPASQGRIQKVCPPAYNYFKLLRRTVLWNLFLIRLFLFSSRDDN